MIYGVPLEARGRAVIDRCRALHDLHGGRLFVHIHEADRQEQALADHVLEALGKRPHERRPPLAGRRTWERIHAWLLGEQIREIYVAPVDNANPQARRRLLDLAARCGLTVYLIRGGGRRQWWKPLCEKWQIVELPEDDFLEQLPAPAAPPPTLPPPFPAVPETRLEEFLSEVARTLPREDFLVVAAALRDARATTLRWRKKHPNPTGGETGDFCRSLLDPSTSYMQALTIARGIEIGFRLTNTRTDLLFDGSRFALLRPLAYPEDLERGGADRLRWYTDNDRAAAAVVRIVSRCSIEQIVNLTVADLAEDGTSVRVDGRDHPVPPRAHGILRTQWIDRQTAAADSTAPLFIVEATTHFPQPVTIKGVHRWFNDITRFCDVVVTNRFARNQKLSGKDWLRVHGMHLITTTDFRSRQ